MGDLGIVAATSRTRSAKALKPSKSVQRSVGRAVGVWLPGDDLKAIDALAREQRSPRNRVLTSLIRRGLEGSRGDAGAGKPTRCRRSTDPLERVVFRIGRQQKRRMEAYRVEQDFRDLSSAVAELIGEALDGKGASTGSARDVADHVADDLQAVLLQIDRLAPGVLGVLRLIAHWAVQAGSLDVDEDELVAEAWAAGEREWAARQTPVGDATATAPDEDEARR
jgi:hypothetical protein